MVTIRRNPEQGAPDLTFWKKLGSELVSEAGLAHTA
jgi:hypothetical protein